MEIVLIDTSVWISFFKGNETPASLYLKNNLGNIAIAICPVIMQEVLQGIANERDVLKVESYFDSLIYFRSDPYSMAKKSAELYRNLRKSGITIRKPNDCLIAIYALENNCKLLHEDRDFEQISSKYPLQNILRP